VRARWRSLLMVLLLPSCSPLPFLVARQSAHELRIVIIPTYPTLLYLPCPLQPHTYEAEIELRRGDRVNTMRCDATKAVLCRSVSWLLRRLPCPTPSGRSFAGRLALPWFMPRIAWPERALVGQAGAGR
jgi:hypothetical protein